ncbi:MAG TPA: hypothetical protein VMY78_07720 [Solirubrobacteraceae bacterium]|nr:hypothetical protein [Solirubrobacteraceae bacterium]
MTAEGLDLARDRDLEGRAAHPWIRRAILTIFAVIVLLGLTGVFGQQTVTRSAAAAQARLELDAPSALRGGLMWRARISVRAVDTIEFPRLVLGPGFANGMQINTIEPSPESESSRGPRLVLSYDELKPGDELVVYLQFQVDPTTTGRQDAAVALDDATTPVARVDHTITVFP